MHRSRTVRRAGVVLTVIGLSLAMSTTAFASHVPLTQVSQGGGSSFYDKEWITCDNTATSPYYGNCYVEWDDAGLGNVLKMSRSTNGGTTWQMSTAPGSAVIGGQPVTQPNGRVVMPISDAFSNNV